MSAWDVIAGQFFKQKTPGNKQRPSDRRLEDFLGKSSKLRANAIIAVSVFDSSMEKALLRKGSFFCAKGRVAKLDCGVACAKALGPVIASYAKYVWGEKGLCAKRLLRALWGKRGVLGLSLCGQACFAPMLGCFFKESLSCLSSAKETCLRVSFGALSLSVQG